MTDTTTDQTSVVDTDHAVAEQPAAAAVAASVAAPAVDAAAAAGPTPPNVADVEEALRDVVDPELGINVVDLGLIYGVTVDQHPRRTRGEPPDQLGVDAAVGSGQDHRRRSRAAESPRLQRLSTDGGLTCADPSSVLDASSSAAARKRATSSALEQSYQ